MFENKDTQGRTLRLGIFIALVVAVLAIIGMMLFGSDEATPPPATPTPAETPAGEAETPVTQEIPPSFDVVRISRGGTGVIAGRGVPGATVELYAFDQLVGSAVADRNGEWVMILEEPLEPGPSELSLVSHLDGAESRQSDDIVVIAIPEREVNPDTNGVVAVLQPRDGDGASRVLQKPGAPPVAEIGDSLSIDTIDYTSATGPILTGQAVPRARVAIYLDNRFIGVARVNDAGAWSYQFNQALPEGDHVLRLDQVLSEGDVQLRIEQPFTTGLPIDQSMRDGSVVVQPGNSLWHIARRIYGSGVQYTLIFQQNQDQIRDPDLIYPGQLFDLPEPQDSAN